MKKSFKATVSGVSKNPTLFGDDIIELASLEIVAESREEAVRASQVVQEEYAGKFLRLWIYVNVGDGQ